MNATSRARAPAVSPARAAAFDILMRVELERSYASELLHSGAFRELTPADHGLATELAMGVLRWRSRLDDEIALNSSQKLAKVDIEVLIALRLGVYQLRWLNRIPARAAIHESVELVKRARKRSAAPFVNAVLRKVERSRGVSPDESTQLLASGPGRLYAHPLWMVERWARQYGLAAAEHICRYDQSVPDTAIRIRAPEVQQELAAEGIVLAPGTLLRSAYRVQAGDLTKTLAFREGRVAIQDEASQLVALLVGRGARILDCCAAPGGKTRVLAEQNPDARITAVEVHPHRARLLRRLLAQETSRTIDVVVADTRKLPTDSTFDRVLTDVPCSGTGTLARNPEIKWRLEESHLLELQKMQLEILGSAWMRLASGGRLVYSSCSLEREENEDVIEQTLTRNPEIRLVDCREELARLRESGELALANYEVMTRGPYLRTIPGEQRCDGFFAAVLERS